MPHKIINLNTAEPALIGRVIGDYLSINDYDTLRSIGLSTSLINELKKLFDTVTSNYDFSNVFQPLPSAKFASLFVKNYIRTQRLYPPKDMDIPGDLYKLIIRKNNSPSSNVRDRDALVDASGSILSGSTGLRGPSFHIVNYNEAYSSPATAPSYNRFLTLFDSYGAWQSYIMRCFLTTTTVDGASGETTFGPGQGVEDYGFRFGYFPGQETADIEIMRGMFLGAGDDEVAPGLRAGDNDLPALNDALSRSGSRIQNLDAMSRYKLPYGVTGSTAGFNNIFDQGIGYSFLRAGILAGHNYEYYKLSPTQQQEVDQLKADNNVILQYANEYAPPSKLQVSSKLRNMKGFFPEDARLEPRATYFYKTYRAWKYYVSRKYKDPLRTFSDPNDQNFPYLVPGLVATYQGNVENRESGLFLEFGPGNRRTATLSAYEPVVEFPKVFSGNLFRPLEHPFGKYVINNDLDSAIEFVVELAQHYEAISTWVEAGMPCDWPDWKNFITTDQAAIIAQQEAAAQVELTTYIPITTSSPSPPTAPKEGDQWYDTTTGKTKVWREINPTLGYWVDA